MSFVGKFFVVMQILLSVTFMGFAVTVFTYQKDWKAEAEKKEANYQQVNSQLQNLQGEFDKFKKDSTSALKDAQDRADRAEATVSAQKITIEDLQAEKEQVSNLLQSQTALAEITEDEAESRRTEAMTERVANSVLHDKLKKKTDEALAIEDELFNVKTVRDALIQKNKELAEEIAFLKKVVRNNGLETDRRIYNAQQDPPPKVDGIVVKAAKNKKGSVDLVEISLGSDDGLVKGHLLSVFRSGLQPGEKAKYLGQIRLVYVDSDQAVGEIVQKAKSGIIKRGDNVTSRL